MTREATGPVELPRDAAAAVGPLALALCIWETAGLEAGETAIYTSGSPADHWIGTVARWRSARDAVRLDVDGDTWVQQRGIENRVIAESQEAAGLLAARLRNVPGVVAAILTPDAIAADVILEALPMWGRIVLAVPASKPASIDFYVNVHRKGTRILSAPGSAAELSDACWSPLGERYVARAMRILLNKRLAAECMP